jgi:tetratricopeptide (TPR) repeat protein
MRKTLKPIKNPDLRFASSESFGFFMEGLRALREYSKEAEKDLPDRDALNRQLDDAIEYLEKCEARDPENPPALYSLGLALTMKNQRHYAQMLSERTKNGRLGRPHPRAWPLLDRVEELFGIARDKSHDKLKVAAAFNLAHTYAKQDEADDLSKTEAKRDTGLSKIEVKRDSGLSKARDLLEELKGEIDSGATPYGRPLELAPRRGWRRWLFVLRWRARHASSWIARTLERIGWRQTDSKPRQEFDEATAIRVQTINLLEWVSLRIDPANASIDYIEKRTDTVEKAMRGEKNIPSGVKNDLIADFRTKMGFLLYERAFAVSERELALKKAEGYLLSALELKKNWDPAQIYLAQVLQAQARFDEADRYLEAVLGAETAEPQKESAKEDSSGKTDS